MTIDKIIRQSFIHPSDESKPTPLYWWSGGDIDLRKLEQQLVKLQERGIGGTIVGYSHLPNGDLDHGNPEPLSPEWWETFRSFVELSAGLNMTVGIQDYGIIGSILLAAGAQTQGLNSGSLENKTHLISGPTIFREPNVENTLSRRAVSPTGDVQLDIASSEGDTVVWDVPPGEWILSTVTIRPGKIGLHKSMFDPMHPNAGKEVINLFYSKFEQELGAFLGSTFTTFFQDELDLGLTMPMWNETVKDRLEDLGYSAQDDIHRLWHGTKDLSFGIRAAHRDVVVELLQEHFFKPIFEWHEQHSTLLVMDQLSRGDLELGYQHYADFLETMSWFHGPGNDDPDLTQARNIAAFRISSSIANLNNRPLVANEAFHSSGWGVTPQMIISGLNVDFAAGANQVILHGLNYTTNAGWWEWASPDFHFRQPWWDHSESVWTYISRVSALLRTGKPVVDIAIIDPTQELVFNPNSNSPKLTSQLLEFLSLNAINADLVPQSYFGKSYFSESLDRVEIEAREARYSVIVIPNLSTIRANTLTALTNFVEAGGLVIALNNLPQQTEFGRINSSDLELWHLVEEKHSLINKIKDLVEVDLVISENAQNIIYSHRKVDEIDIYFIVNSGTQSSEFDIEIRRSQSIELWDPWSGQILSYPSNEVSSPKGNKRQRATVQLDAGQSLLLIQTVFPSENTNVSSSQHFTESDFSTDWSLQTKSNLDNSFGDFQLPAKDLEISSFNVEVSDNQNGPWSSALINHGCRFLVSGPIDERDAAKKESEIIKGSALTEFRNSPHWREYPLSLQTGIPNDAYLLDRNTGPHGLKGVQDEFLDPLAVDDNPAPGSYYYFCSSVDSLGEIEFIRSQGRAAYKVWLNGEVVVETSEDKAEFFPPWGLRNMSAEEKATKVLLQPGNNLIVIRVQVSADQPTRVGVAVGGSKPEYIEKTLCSWWYGDNPALKYHVPNKMTPKWFRVDVPVGATAATIQTCAALVPESVSTFIEIEGGYKIEIANGEKLLTFALAELPSCQDPLDSGALTAPIIWDCGAAESILAHWPQLGLRDFSGLVHYEKTLELTEAIPEGLYLRLEDLEGTAVVKVNSEVAGTIVLGTELIRIDEFLVLGKNNIEIEAANTLVNLFSHLPSPFSTMQKASGGFTKVVLLEKK